MRYTKGRACGGVDTWCVMVVWWGSRFGLALAPLVVVDTLVLVASGQILLQHLEGLCSDKGLMAK